MSPVMVQVLVVAFVVWGAAVAVKAWRALRSNQPYVFAMWDGGMLRVGKRLSRRGMQIKVVVGAAMSIGCVVVITRVAPMPTAAYVLMVVAIVSIVADLVYEEKSALD